MPGKKKKGKGKAEKGEGLPPPPHLDDTRQGAVEALLKFRITGKEDTIEQIGEETESFKDKNDQLKEKNHYLKIQRTEHYKSLIKQSKEHEKALEKSPATKKETVEQALTEKLQLTKQLKDDLKECEESIVRVDQELVSESRELAIWTNYRDVVEHKNSAKIASIKEKIERMSEESANLQSDYDAKLLETEIIMERQTAVLLEKEKERVSERFFLTMDSNTRAELSDNAWLKKEIATTREIVDQLAHEISSLEHRNLKTIDTVTKEQEADVESTREVYLATNRKSLVPPSETLKQAGDRSGLPSLVNIALCTSEQGPGGQAGQLEMKLLSLKGCKVSAIPPPDMFHLPPLDQQLSSQKSVPTKTLWPITNMMLKSVAS